MNALVYSTNLTISMERALITESWFTLLRNLDISTIPESTILIRISDPDLPIICRIGYHKNLQTIKTRRVIRISIYLKKTCVYFYIKEEYSKFTTGPLLELRRKVKI